MHTFFINTAKSNEIEKDRDILEIQRETRRIVSFNCPLNDWGKLVPPEEDDRATTDTENGTNTLPPERYYERCVRKMGEAIDSYRDLNNNFNVVVYVDLLELAAYTSFPSAKQIELYHFLEALHVTLRHYINATLVKRLQDEGRLPREVLVIFEQNAALTDGSDIPAEAAVLYRRRQIRTLLGLPGNEELSVVVNDYFAGGADDLAGTVTRLHGRSEFPYAGALCDVYSECLAVFLEEARGKQGDLLEASLDVLADSIADLGRREDEDGVKSVAFHTNRRAGVNNKQENTRRDLRLYFYLLECMRTPSLFVKGSRGDSVRPFPSMDGKWERVEQALREKRAMFGEYSKMLEDRQEDLTSLHLAPRRVPLDHAKFRLDDFGERTDDMTPPEFLLEDYPTFHDPGVDESKAADDGRSSTEEKPMTEAEKYKRKGERLAAMHRSYLKRIGEHLNSVLTHYVSQDPIRAQVLLPRRKVSVAEDGVRDDEVAYNYGLTDRPEERDTKTVSELSVSAYRTALEGYADFCVSHEVKETDISDACARYAERIDEIETSIKHIRMWFLLLTAALAVLYLPFVIIQWRAITENVMTLSTAVASFAVPLVILYVIYLSVSMRQKKQYALAWEALEKHSEEACAQNDKAVRAFDTLLAFYVPSLRWLYEYKLDVAFYEECAAVANSKLRHHRDKMLERVKTVDNILRDLESEMDTEDPDAVDARASMGSASGEPMTPDYHVAFCSSAKNRKFYSIADEDLLDELVGTKGGETA